jgi:membrane protein
MFSLSRFSLGRKLQQFARRWGQWQLWLRIYNNIDEKHTWPMAAALAFYFLLALFPALILFSAAVAFLPGHTLFDQALSALALFVPGDSMRLVTGVLSDVITPHRSTYASLGLIGTVYTASNSVSASIEALNVASGATEDRPFWKTRSLSLMLAVLIGGLLIVALTVMLLGPRFGDWLAARIYVSGHFVWLWPAIHWAIAVSFTVVAVEIMYVFAPNVEQRFRDTLPGAALAVSTWLALSYGLGVYFRHFADFHKTYGTLGAAISLLIWLYWTGFAFLLGAELNGELAKQRRIISAAEGSQSAERQNPAA